jgi:nucleotide-binding universal stress UspA family protein
MHLQTIVALTDFSASAEQALDRAALVAAHHGARLRLVFGTEVPDPRFTDPHARLAQRARQLARRHGISVHALPPGSGQVVEDTLAAAAGADLLVMDRRGGFGLRTLRHGRVLARVLRRSPCPVLVVQREPQGAYRHLLVAVDFSPACLSLARYAGGIQADAQLELYHAIDTRDEAKLRSAEASMQAVEAYRAQRLQNAQRRMLPLANAYDARRNRVATVIGNGDPARELAVHHEAVGADLVAVGYTPRLAWVEWWLGSVVQRLMGWADCDVLVFPTRCAMAQEKGTSAWPGVGAKA